MPTHALYMRRDFQGASSAVHVGGRATVATGTGHRAVPQWLCGKLFRAVPLPLPLCDEPFECADKALALPRHHTLLASPVAD